MGEDGMVGMLATNETDKDDAGFVFSGAVAL